jgi:glutathione synthase/RimK-type ligase-like ATP-grasp enzyme
MANIRIIGRKGNKTCRLIVKDAGIPRFTGGRNRADILVNFGLAGAKRDAFLKRFPSAGRIPTINKNCGYSKLNVVNRAKQEGIEVPDSKLTLSKSDKKGDWIEKKFSSVGGIGIRSAKNKAQMNGKYYQRFVTDRKYELRVHAFLWMDQYSVQKRVGDPKEITWNFKNGGTFITVKNPNHGVFEKAIDTSTKILKDLGMAFGAVDFIVTKDHRLLFLEVNSAPGVSGLSDAIYIDAFKKLRDLSLTQLKELAR